MTQPIWYDSTEAGAPSLNNAAGSLIEVLRGCLVNGFGSKAALSISVSAGVATLTSAAHGFTATAGKLVQVTGCTEAALDGLKQPLTVSTNELTYAATGVADGSYGGSITVKRPGLGWSEAYTDGTRSLFARLAPESTAMLLRVDNSNSAPAAEGNARVTMVESATGLDAVVNSSPTSGQMVGGLYWEWRSAAGNRAWALWGDERFFYIALPWNGAAAFYLHYFGDVDATFQPDAYCCTLAGARALTTSGSYSSISTMSQVYGNAVTEAGIVFSRGDNQTTLSVPSGVMGLSTPSRPIGDSATGQTRLDFVQIVDTVFLFDTTSVRGVLPGLAAPLGRRPFVASPNFSVHTIDGSARSFSSVISYTGTGATSYVGNVLIDVSGPWR